MLKNCFFISKIKHTSTAMAHILVSHISPSFLGEIRFFNRGKGGERALVDQMLVSKMVNATEDGRGRGVCSGVVCLLCGYISAFLPLPPGESGDPSYALSVAHQFLAESFSRVGGKGEGGRKRLTRLQVRRHHRRGRGALMSDGNAKGGAILGTPVQRTSATVRVGQMMMHAAAALHFSAFSPVRQNPIFPSFFRLSSSPCPFSAHVVGVQGPNEANNNLPI